MKDAYNSTKNKPVRSQKWEQLDQEIKEHATIRSFTDKTYNKQVYIIECTLYGKTFKGWNYALPQLYQDAHEFFRTIKKRSDCG